MYKIKGHRINNLTLSDKDIDTLLKDYPVLKERLELTAHKKMLAIKENLPPVFIIVSVAFLYIYTGFGFLLLVLCFVLLVAFTKWCFDSFI